jgi:hypothetical protein
MLMQYDIQVCPGHTNIVSNTALINTVQINFFSLFLFVLLELNKMGLHVHHAASVFPCCRR